MREDRLKEQLLGYASDGAEPAFRPGAVDVRRRGRRHYQRLVVLVVTGALVVPAASAWALAAPGRCRSCTNPARR